MLEALWAAGFSPLILQSGLWPPGFDPAGLRVARLPGAGLLPGLLTLGQAQIAWQVHRRRLALVHDPTGVFPLAIAGCKRVVTVHDVFPLSFPGYSAALDTLIYRTWLPIVLPRADALITVSHHSKHDLCRCLPLDQEKVFVIPEAAGSQFRPLPPAESQPVLDRLGLSRPYILYVGSLEPRKNLLRLLDAYQELLAWSSRWRLVIVGARNYWKSSPVAEKVERLGLGRQVSFTGYVPDADLPALYSAADLFCFPSLYEGFGLPVLEAMACGAPVVTSNTSSLPEVAGDAALLVDPYNVAEIALAMRRILSDPELAADLRQRGLLRAAQFTWERTARQTIEVYQKVLGKA